MAINFGILQPIQSDAKPLMGSAPGASAPSIRQNDGLQDFAEGFLNSYSKGLQASTQSENLKQQQLQTEDMQIKAQDRDSLRAAAQEGLDAYRTQLYQQNPVQAVEFDTTMAKKEEQLERVKSISMDNYKKLTEAQANFYGNIAGGRNDEERAQIQAMQYQNLPDAVKKTVSPVYSPNDFAAGMLTNQRAIAELAPKKQPAESPLGKLQSDATALQNDINRRKQMGQDTTQQEQQLAQLNQAAQRTSQGAMKASELDKSLSKAEGTRYKESMDALEGASGLKDTLAQAKEQLKQIPSASMGPAANWMNLPKFSEAAQVYTSVINNATLQLRTALMKGAGSMSDADLQFLKDIAGGTAVSKMSADKIIDKLTELTEKAQERNYKTADGIMKRSADYQSWKEANPEPMKKQTTNQQSSGSFQEGQIYQDANGNKARYVNGKWENM